MIPGYAVSPLLGNNFQGDADSNTQALKWVHMLPGDLHL